VEERYYRSQVERLQRDKNDGGAILPRKKAVRDHMLILNG
jgi:hypothetical protein